MSEKKITTLHGEDVLKFVLKKGIMKTNNQNIKRKLQPILKGYDNHLAI